MAKAKSTRPRIVRHATITGGRRDRSGKVRDLFIRIEKGDNGVAISLGSAENKLQLRCTAKALEEALKLARKS